jgi:hypothetical protein
VATSDTWKLLVFRDGRRELNGSELLRGLSRQGDCVLSLSDFTSQFARDEAIDALLRAGELECALADHEGCAEQARALATLTDDLADAVVRQSKPLFRGGIVEQLPEIPVPEKLHLSVPEGFCYYALHPLDYADLLNASSVNSPAAAIIGIRSIGTTLSAIVRAWFEQHGTSAARITVRPTGHPFDRKLSVDANLGQWIGKQAQAGAGFYIVDEGPGLSGSSFLAVAEALVDAGISHDRIVLLPSSTPNPEALSAPNAGARWACFRTLPLKPTRYIPPDASLHIGGGEWRKHVFASESDWPAIWSWTERQKYFSSDGARIFRFDGHGHYGKAVRQRSKILAAHNWGPETGSAGDGFSISPWITGNHPNIADREVVIQLARYCAFRAQQFTHEPASASALEQMTRINLERAVGVSRSVTLPIERPVITDSRMMPHEWIFSPSRRLLKVDASTHGDDHFYPGPADIAWDLAGAIVEWKLDSDAADLLVEEYVRSSGDQIARRLPGYLVAYCVFRLAFTSSARNSIDAGQERARFEREAATFRTKLATLLQLSTAA